MKLSISDIEFIKANYKELGCNNISKTLNVHPYTVYRQAKKFNLQGNPRKFTAIYLSKNCKICNKEFKISENALTFRKGIYCSKECFVKDPNKVNTLNSRQKICAELKEQGFSTREISQKTGFKIGSVASSLNRAFFRRQNGISFASVRNRFLKVNKSCQICGFDRIVEAAHIIAASKKGPHAEDNFLALCPNHHHLFDHNRLLEEEYKMIEDKINYSKGKYLSV